MGHDDRLGKYPTVIALGDTLTREQTNEVMLRTNRWTILSCNDEHWDDMVTCILGISDALDAYLNENGFWDWELRWELMESFGDKIKALKLFALDNEAIMTSCVDGPCGWLDWSGRIQARYTEGSKWTSVEEVDHDWRKIAATFPFLRLRAQLAAGNYLSDVPTGTIGAEWVIEDGTATRVEPGRPLVRQPRWYHKPINQWYEFPWWRWKLLRRAWKLYYQHRDRRWSRTGTWPMTTDWSERCVPAPRLIEAVDQVRKAHTPNTFTPTDIHQ